MSEKHKHVYRKTLANGLECEFHLGEPVKGSVSSSTLKWSGVCEEGPGLPSKRQLLECWDEYKAFKGMVMQDLVDNGDDETKEICDVLFLVKPGEIGKAEIISFRHKKPPIVHGQFSYMDGSLERKLKEMGVERNIEPKQRVELEAMTAMTTGLAKLALGKGGASATVPPSACPYCGKESIDSAMAAMTSDDKRKPRPGDVSICMYCLETVEFDKEMKLIKLRIETLLQMKQDPDQAYQICLVKKMIRSARDKMGKLGL